MERRLVAMLLVAVVRLALPAPAFAATATVTIGASLSPKSLTVAPGATVTWRNADSGRHRVRTTSAPVELDSNDLEPGESWSFTFRTAGTYRYVDHRDEDDPAYWGTVTVSSTAPTSGPVPSPSVLSGGTTTSAPATAAVGMAGRAFSPSSVSVRAGGTVTFTNDDDRAHTVTANDGSFDSGVLNAGSRWSRRFPSAGTFRYLCAIHPDMTGTVTVPTSNGTVPPPAPAAPRPAVAPAAPAAPAPSAGAPGATATIRVDVVDFGYAPARATARVGDTVMWVNTGAAPHTVTAAGAPFGTPLLAAGTTYRWSPTRTGTWAYVCTFHPQMTGTLVVLPRSAARPANVAAPARGAEPTAAPPAETAPANPPSPAPDVTAAPHTRSIRPVATASPLVAWSLWGSVGLVVFLALAWWRGREPANPRG